MDGTVGKKEPKGLAEIMAQMMGQGAPEEQEKLINSEAAVRKTTATLKELNVL